MSLVQLFINMMTLRCRVLSLYKQTLRTGTNWLSKSGNPEETVKEKDYILSEAKRLFRKNMNVTNEKEILNHILEAESRLQIAVHYRNPYPRPVNLPPSSYASRKGKIGKVQAELIKKSRPVYVKSIDDPVKKKP